MPAAGPTGLRLVGAERRTFAGPADFLSDPANRAAVTGYLSDLTRAFPGGPPGPPSPDLVPAEQVPPEQGHSYGEMAEALIGALVPPDQPVGLLVLAYSVHDVQPGRATATYLSHICPGTPMAFAVCDQGSAAAYSALRIARDYPAPDGSPRALVIVVEQAALPYGDGTALPAQHRGVAMLFEHGTGAARSRPGARLSALVQRPGLAPGAVAGQAAADLAELSAGSSDVRLVLSRALATAWPGHPGDGVRIGPAGQPSTGIWWQLLDELDAGTGRPGLLVAADYDPQLRCLSLAAIEPA